MRAVPLFRPRPQAYEGSAHGRGAGGQVAPLVADGVARAVLAGVADGLATAVDAADAVCSDGCNGAVPVVPQPTSSSATIGQQRSRGLIPYARLHPSHRGKILAGAIAPVLIDASTPRRAEGVQLAHRT